MKREGRKERRTLYSSRRYEGEELACYNAANYFLKIISIAVMAEIPIVPIVQLHIVF